MQGVVIARAARVALGFVLIWSLAACVVAPTHETARPYPGAQAPTPHQIAERRLQQVNTRANELSLRITRHVNEGGYYAPGQATALHRRLDVTRRQAAEFAARQGGGLSPDQQRVMNQELDDAARFIR